MATKKHTIPLDKLELYNKVIKIHPLIERKGKNNPYTSLKGHMFSFLDKEGKMGLRFSKEYLVEFNKKYGGGPNVQYGSVMNGYAIIPDDLLEDTDKLLEYLEISYQFITTLKPKPSKKKKTGTSSTSTFQSLRKS